MFAYISLFWTFWWTDSMLGLENKATVGFPGRLPHWSCDSGSRLGLNLYVFYSPECCVLLLTALKVTLGCSTSLWRVKTTSSSLKWKWEILLFWWRILTLSFCSLSFCTGFPSAHLPRSCLKVQSSFSFSIIAHSAMSLFLLEPKLDYIPVIVLCLIGSDVFPVLLPEEVYCWLLNFFLVLTVVRWHFIQQRKRNWFLHQWMGSCAFLILKVTSMMMKAWSLWVTITLSDDDC